MAFQNVRKGVHKINIRLINQIQTSYSKKQQVNQTLSASLLDRHIPGQPERHQNTWTVEAITYSSYLEDQHYQFQRYVVKRYPRILGKVEKRIKKKTGLSRSNKQETPQKGALRTFHQEKIRLDRRLRSANIPSFLKQKITSSPKRLFRASSRKVASRRYPHFEKGICLFRSKTLTEKKLRYFFTKVLKRLKDHG